MKLFKLGILILMLAATAACTIEEQQGLELAGLLACDQEAYPTADGAPAAIQEEGSYDTQVARYNPLEGYIIHPAVTNSRGTTENSDFLASEGNNITLTHFEIEYEVPVDWDPIEKIKVPLRHFLGPGDKYTAKVNIVPESVRYAIEENYANNAYKSNRGYATLRPEPNDSDGNPIACTNGNAKDVCLGYPCITPSGDPTIKNEQGICSNACTLASGCARACTEAVCNRLDEEQIFRCDVGVGDYGICRPTCNSGVNDCTPIPDPEDPSKNALEYECIRGTCFPADTTVNPNKEEMILVKIRAKGDNSDGSGTASNSVTFRLNICRSCLLRFNEYWCNSTPVDLDKEQKDYEESFEAVGNKCQLVYQDWPVQCAWLPGCWGMFCPPYNAYIKESKQQEESQ